MPNNEEGVLVSSTAKALNILNCFAGEQSELTLSQISKQLGLPKSTVLNQLRTLEEGGFISKSRELQTYRLGFRIMELSYFVRISTPIIQFAVPLMEELQEQTGEIIYLTSCVDGKVMYLECLYPSKRSVAYSVNGKMRPMHSTGCGKAMLSQMSTDKVEAIIRKEGLPRITANTITNYDEFLEELAASRARGYALDNEEDNVGVKCIAMAIRTSGGQVAGALSISGSSMAMKSELMSDYATKLSRACNALSPYANMFPYEVK